MGRYLISFAVTFISILAASFAVNWYVDPFGYFGRHTFGVYSDSYAAEYKAATVKKYSHEITIIGTSKTHQIDPDDVRICKIFNASINGIRTEQILHLIKNFIPEDKFVLIGLDFFAFREDSYRRTTFGLLTFENVTNYTLSLKAIELSYKNFHHWRKKDRLLAMKKNGAKNTLSDKRANEAATSYDYSRYLKIARKQIFNKFKLSERRLKELGAIRILLEDRNQPHAFFINPVSPGLLAFFKEEGLFDLFTNFIKRVKKIVPNVYDFSTGKYRKRELFYKTDPLHYLPHTGKLFIEDIIAERGCDGRKKPFVNERI